MHLGEPTARQKECYTRVLMGHIGLASAVFPADTPGFMVDSFARRALWQAGLDYRHGTGHGVGAALNVHEGPHGISPKFGNTTPLQKGMVVSNEPGYYEVRTHTRRLGW
jgi:Xaa-Pro aminopeptidase